MLRLKSKVNQHGKVVVLHVSLTACELSADWRMTMTMDGEPKKKINQVVHVNIFACDSRSSLRWEHWSQLAGRKNREASSETETFLVFGRANSQCLAACVVKSQEISGPKAHWIPKDRAHECLNVFLVLPFKRAKALFVCLFSSVSRCNRMSRRNLECN